MNVKRFVARTAREALSQARAAWGDEAVVLSNREIPGGVEIMAMSHGDASRLAPAVRRAQARPALRAAASGGVAEAHAEAPEAAAQPAPQAVHAIATRTAQPAPSPAAARRHGPALPAEPMSTVSFERFVRERQRLQPPTEPGRFAAEELMQASPASTPADAPTIPVLTEIADPSPLPAAAALPSSAAQMLAEVRELRESLGAQLAGMAWFGQVQRQPVHTRMLRQLLEGGFSPALARHLVERLAPSHDDATARRWLEQVMQRNLACATDAAQTPATLGGTYALVGPAGGGKTSACARLARAHAQLHGPASVALVALEPWPGAAEPLRAVGRTLGLPAQVARDQDSLTELLSLLQGRSLVLVDTPATGASAERRRALAQALPASLERLLVLPANAQAESLEEAAEVESLAQAGAARCIFTRVDETHRAGVIVDLALRRKLRIEALLGQADAGAEGETPHWPLPDPAALVARALAPRAPTAFSLQAEDLGLLLTAPAAPAAPAATLHRPGLTH